MKDLSWILVVVDEITTTNLDLSLTSSLLLYSYSGATILCLAACSPLVSIVWLDNGRCVFWFGWAPDFWASCAVSLSQLDKGQVEAVL